jgi:hypothetical protein
MNILNLIHWPWWTPWALGAAVVLVAIILLGSLKSLIGWPGLAALAIVLALVGGEVDGARRALDWTHSHYHIKGHITDLLAVFNH